MEQGLTDRIRGVIYGQAIGDALGLGAEAMTKAQVEHHYPTGLTRYGQIVRDEHASRWPRGAWTDDTDQMLCILDSLLEQKRVDVVDIARRLRQWAIDGGMGIGRTVFSVLYSPNFITDPHGVAKEVWEKSSRYLAANGGVMRTSILGVWDYQHSDHIRYNAEQVCKITHYDPRCVGSCVLVNLAISALLKGETDSDAIFQQAHQEAPKYDSRITEYLDRAKDSLAALDLAEGLDPETKSLGKIGYTLKAMGAGFWALEHAGSFKDGIVQVIREGGDADTNAAVVGAMLGARCGFSQISPKWAAGLANRHLLDNRIERLACLFEQLGEGG